MLELLANHQIGATLIAGCAGLSFVNALPQPLTGGSVLYRFFYDFAHSFWLNVMKIKAVAGPGESAPKA